MIKIGITSAGTTAAGELVRILVNHPDVEIVGLYEPELAGSLVTSRHHGLIGETELRFTDRLDFTDLNLLIICGDTEITDKVMTDESLYPELRVIDLGGRYRTRRKELGLTYGLSELFRKPLVRGAKRAVLPTPFASAALVALGPWAGHLMLTSPLRINIHTPQSFDSAEVAQEITEILSEIQTSFTGPVEIERRAASYTRAVMVEAVIDIPFTVADALHLYDGIYDDHNFSFAVTDEPDVKEVEGTSKCIISVSVNEGGGIRLQCTADATMRGGAGEAVHIMNLLFGLHERTGLALKASNY